MKAILTAILATSLPLLAVDPPAVINHQGRIAVSGTNYAGTGHFKFAFVDAAGTTTYWSNDGTGSSGSEPTDAVAVAVDAGHYATGLGDTALANMTALPDSLFTENDDVHLRIWFGQAAAGPFEQLTPDRRVTSAGYALSAGSAASVADGAVTTDMLADGAVTPGKMETTYQSRRGYGFDDLDLSTLASGSASLSTTFEKTFTTPPDLELDDSDGSISTLTETGFTATFSFSPSVVGDFEETYFTSLAQINGRPAIAFSGKTAGEANSSLKFAHATDPEGSAWNVVTVDEAPNINSLSLAVVNGVPAIAYQDSDNDLLKYAHATDTEGTSWNVMTLDSGEIQIGIYCSLAVIGGVPAISYHGGGVGENPSPDLLYIRARDAHGSAWEAPVTADQQIGEAMGFGSSLREVNGRPMISHFAASQGDSLLKCAYADDPEGSSWTKTTIASGFGEATAFDLGRMATSLELINGIPSVAYQDWNSFDIKFVHATNPEGTAWVAPTIVEPSNTAYLQNTGSLTSVNGVPAFSYFYQAASSGAPGSGANGIGDLRFAYAGGNLPSSWDDPGDWTRVDVDLRHNDGSTSFLTGGTADLTMINGVPAISYSKEFSDIDRQLRYAALPIPSWSAGVGGSHHLQAASVEDGAVLTDSLASASVTGDKIAVDSITTDKIRSASITIDKLALGGSPGQVLTSDGSSATWSDFELPQYFLDDGSEDFAGQLNVVGGKVRIDNNQSYAALDSSGTLREMLKKTVDDETSIATAQNENIIFRDGSNTNMAMTGDNGYFGIRELDPLARLHVRNLDTGFSEENRAEIYVEDEDASIFLLSTEGGDTGSSISLVEIDSNTGLLTDRWTFARETTDGGSAGSLLFNYNDGAPTSFTAAELAANGDLTIAGTYFPTSDREAKEDFEDIDPTDILDKVLGMPVTRWSYKASPETEHIGPVAQDFHAAFQVGIDNKHISTTDADGVALAAIQGLNAKVEKKNSRIDALEKQNTELRERLEKLEAAIESLNQKQ